jgi:hypothetical protein
MVSEFPKVIFRGSLHLWKYLEQQSNYPGFNLTADKDGCDSMIELLTCFKNVDHKPTKTITLNLTTPEIARVGTTKSKFKTFSTLTLNLIDKEENIWIVEEQPYGEIKISFSRFYLSELVNAIERVRVHEGDFSIADKKRKNILYFWWYLGH